MLCSFGLFFAFMRELGMKSPERGGIIGGKGGIATHFFYDETASTAQSYYIPDVPVLNRVLREWSKDGIALMGIAHSHQNEDERLSTQDVSCARAILEANPFLKELEFPIILPESQGRWMVSYCIDREAVRKSKLYFYCTKSTN